MDSTNRLRSIKLWPPSNNTRLVLVQRIVKNLTSPSILSRKYGLLSEEEAEEEAKQIESSAFTTANHHFEKEPDGDGGSAVQLYAKESSKLMVEIIKRGPKTKLNQETTFENITNGHEQTVFDISGGSRAFIEAEECNKLLKPLTLSENKYTKIIFSNRSFGLEAARVAAPILSNIKQQLTDVDFSDIVAGRPEAEALEVMKIFSEALEDSTLRSLNLSQNALGEKGLRAFGKLLSSQNSLEELYLVNDGISEAAAKALCEILPPTKTLKTLHFHNNMTGDEGAIAISKLVKESIKLEDFRCSTTRVCSEGGIALSEALRVCTDLKKLDLRDNMFGVEGGIALSKSVQSYNKLTEVYLSDLNLENEGTIALVNALKNSDSALEVFEIGGNEITSKSASALAELIIRKKGSLKKINFSENDLKDEGAIVIGKALEEEFNRLAEVDMSTNKIRTAGARVLAKAVVGKAGFRLLNINENFLSDEGVEEVKEIFKDYPDVIGSLDENDPEGEDDDDDDENENEGENEDELESKLKDLEIKEEE